jgi:IPT/TIG domain-containing protein
MTAQYQVMTYRIAIPEGDMGVGTIVSLPQDWVPLAAVRQGETALVLCSKQLAGPPPVGNPPVLNSLTPDTLAAGTTPATIDVLGSGFDASSTIYADSDARATFFIDNTHLEYTARPDLATSGEVHQITVVGDTGTSNALPFTYT